MRQRKIIVILTVISLLLLSACSSQEQIEYGAWKKNLQQESTAPEQENAPTQEDTSLAQGDNNQEESNSDTEITFLDKVKNFFQPINTAINDFNRESNNKINSLVDSIQDEKYAIENNGLIKVKLLRVVDGDTLLVNYKDEVYIRLIGINTPESVHPDAENNTQEGEAASEYTKQLLKDTEYVWLEFDTNLYDGYDRILAYVWLSNDTQTVDNMLNFQLLQSGQALPMTIEPNTKYADAFEDAMP